MSKRTKISSNPQTEVLTQSDRRCCICYGLHNDFSVKKGQIAHLDQNSANSSLDNLVWLCFEHHDEYDSTTRQSKGLTNCEVRDYRDELYDAVSQMRNKPEEDIKDNSLFIVTYDSNPSVARVKTEDQFILLKAREGAIENYMLELTREVLFDLKKYNSSLPTKFLLFDFQDYQQLMLRGIFFDDKNGAATLYIDLLYDIDATPIMTTMDIEKAFYKTYGDQSIFVDAAIIYVTAGSDSFFPISKEFYSSTRLWLLR